MKYVYPAIFRPEPEGNYHVFFPDIDGAGTCGDDLKDCISMGEDWLCLKLYDMEQQKEHIPEPSNINEIEREEGDVVTLISVDTERYKRFYENKSVKKTLTIPSWLNVEAESANVNFSQVLQRALKEELQIAE